MESTYVFLSSLKYVFSVMQGCRELFIVCCRTPLLGQSEYKVEELLEAMLGSGNKNESFQCAALIIKQEKW